MTTDQLDTQEEVAVPSPSSAHRVFVAGRVLADRLLSILQLEPHVTFLILGVFAAVVIHVFRAIYINNAFVTWDEVIYKFLSQIIFNPGPAASRFWPGLADIPDDFYLATYHVCHYFRINAYEAAKILNVLFFCFAAFPIFAATSRVAGPWTSVFVALLACFCPFSAHTTYFMPEAMYYFLFWLAAYLLMRVTERRSALSLALAGGALGLLFLTKPHAIAVLLGANLALVCTALLIGNRTEVSKHRGIVKDLLLLDGSFAALIGLVGYFLVVRTGGSFLGSTYSRIGGEILEVSDIQNLIINLLYVSSGHITYLLVLFGVPWLYLAVGLWREIRSDHPRVACIYLGLLAVFLFLGPFILCVRFTAVMGPELERLHGRYYNFVFPMFVAAFYAFYPTVHKGGHLGRISRLLLGVIAVAVPIAVLAFAIDRRPAVYDFPEVFWFTSGGPILYAVLALTSSVLLYYSLSSRPSQHVLTTLLTLLAVLGSGLAFREQNGNSMARVERRNFATAVDGLIGAEEKNSGMIFSSDIHTALYFQFYLTGIAEVRVVPSTQTLQTRDLSAGTRWIVLLDNYNLAFPYETSIQKPGFWFGRLVPGFPRVSLRSERGRAEVSGPGLRTVAATPLFQTLPLDSREGDAFTFALAKRVRDPEFVRIQARIERRKQLGPAKQVQFVVSAGRLISLSPDKAPDFVVETDGRLHTVYLQTGEISGFSETCEELTIRPSPRGKAEAEVSELSVAIPLDNDTSPAEDVYVWMPEGLEFERAQSKTGEDYGGLLRINGPDPQLTLDLLQSPLAADSVARMSIRFRAEHAGGSKNSQRQIGCLYFRPCDRQFSQDNSVTYSWDAKNEDWMEATIPLESHPNWRGDICALRFDPVHDVTTLPEGFRIRIGRVRLLSRDGRPVVSRSQTRFGNR